MKTSDPVLVQSEDSDPVLLSHTKDFWWSLKAYCIVVSSITSPSESLLLVSLDGHLVSLFREIEEDSNDSFESCEEKIVEIVLNRFRMKKGMKCEKSDDSGHLAMVLAPEPENTIVQFPTNPVGGEENIVQFPENEIVGMENRSMSYG